MSPEPAEPSSFRRGEAGILVLVAALFGLAGIGWGVSDIDPSWGKWVNPFEFISRHPDEPLVVTGGLYFATGTEPYEKMFHWGGTGEFLVSSTIAWALLYGGDATPKSILADHAAGFILIGRLFSALAGIASVLLLYHVGGRFFDRRTGFVGALLFAVSGLYVETAAQFRPDLPSACGMVFCLAGCAALARDRGWRVFALTGLAAGAAAAFRGPNGLIACSALPALVQSFRRDGGRAAARSAAVLAAGVFGAYALLSFQSFLHPAMALSFFRRIGEMAEGDPVEAMGRGPLLWYGLAVVPVQALGPVIPLGGCAGLAEGLARRRAAVLPFAIGAILQILALAGLQAPMARYLLPLATLLVLPCAALLCGSDPALGRGRRALLIAAVLLTAAGGVERIWLRTRPDTRAQAEAWLDAHLPPQSSPGCLTLGSVHFVAWPSVERHKSRLFVSGEYPKALGKASLGEAGVDVWIVHELDWRAVERAGDRHPRLADARFLAGLRAGITPDGARWRRLAEFSLSPLLPWPVPGRADEPDDFLYVSPGIEIYGRISK